MSVKITRSGNQIYVGEFFGTCSDSPNGNYSIGWYCSKTRGRMDDKNFVLLKGGLPIIWGDVASRIYAGKVCDTGRFALDLTGSTNKSTLHFFEADGREIGSKQMRDGLLFFDLSADGRWLFWNSLQNLRCLDLATLSEIFHFQIESRFNATSVKLDLDGTTLLVQHQNKGWYRFGQNGTFLDKEKWLLDYIQDCDGPSLYQVICELYNKQGAKDTDEIKTYAQWIEEAIRRGITDSYYLKISSVYEFLAKLSAEAGDEDKATEAKEEAERNLDGFALVDRAAFQFKELGNPPNQTLAQRLIRDLDRAANTQRLFEYPNYVGRLYRTKGHILELLGDCEGAIVAYKQALEANPQAGCKKQLERLTNAPFVPTEKPKPKPTEERVHLEKSTMFHFCCPICGATTMEVGMSDYLAGWREANIGRLAQLFAVLLAATQEVKESKANSTKAFQAAADDLVTVLSQSLEDKSPMQSPILKSVTPKKLVLQVDCPVCQKPAGPRKKGNYFTVWSEACRVQSSNLFYEVAVILLGLASIKPAWLEDPVRNLCDTVRSKTFRAGESLGLTSCPQCGRFTTCLYGGTRSDPEKGMCRWCSDATGANQITITVNLADVVKQVGQSEEA